MGLQKKNLIICETSEYTFFKPYVYELSEKRKAWIPLILGNP